MPDGFFQARTVVLELAAQEAHDEALRRNVHRFADAYLRLEWVLAREPEERGVRIKQENSDRAVRFYEQLPDDLAETPTIRVIYVFDDDEVQILDMHVA